MPLFLKDLFAKKAENESKKVETSIALSYLEIYNEELKDLFNPDGKNLRIFASSEGVYVQHLSKIVCLNITEANAMLLLGKKLRLVGSHTMNHRSSRSHAICSIYVK